MERCCTSLSYCGEVEGSSPSYLGEPQPEPGELGELEEQDWGSHIDCTVYFQPLYSCGMCGTQFADSVVLVEHMQGEHGRLAPLFKPAYSCAKCPATFYSTAVLLRHVKHH